MPLASRENIYSGFFRAFLWVGEFFNLYIGIGCITIQLISEFRKSTTEQTAITKLLCESSTVKRVGGGGSF